MSVVDSEILEDLNHDDPQLFERGVEAFQAWRKQAADSAIAAGVIEVLGSINDNEKFWEILEEELPLVSDFAKGDGSRGWKIDMDYAVSPNGFIKIAEGGWRKGSEDGGYQSSFGEVGGE